MTAPTARAPRLSIPTLSDESYTNWRRLVDAQAHVDGVIQYFTGDCPEPVCVTSPSEEQMVKFEREWAEWKQGDSKAFIIIAGSLDTVRANLTRACGSTYEVL